MVDGYPPPANIRRMSCSPENPGYHLAHIQKGELGELSKVREELDEAFDAQQQQASVMVLVELSDMLGAVQAYLEKHHPSITMDDLMRFSMITQRAFKNGRR